MTLRHPPPSLILTVWKAEGTAAGVWRADEVLSCEVGGAMRSPTTSDATRRYTDCLPRAYCSRDASAILLLLALRARPSMERYVVRAATPPSNTLPGGILKS
ncbi:hypothetical protein C8J57DRAFT_1530059 [Mycena rebaudengoi]|nr:hypothetical protein C8J57DRAFT_1530059 [Mycena rebaudengoi]